MNTDNKVLACVDHSQLADAVTDCAAWAAARMAAPLELLHVIERHQEIGSGDDHSGAIGVDSQEHLLSELSEKDAARSIRAREAGRLLLNRLRERAVAAGVQALDARQRYGELGENLVEQEARVSVYVFGRHGESAEKRVRRDLGVNVEQVVRVLHKPILTVTEPFRAPRRFMIAFDGGAATRRGVEMVASSPLLRGLPCHILMSGQPGAEGPKLLEWARVAMTEAGFDVRAELVRGDAERVIAQAVREQQIGLLCMGAYAHSPIRGLLLGSRTTDLLRSARVPTLLLR